MLSPRCWVHAPVAARIGKVEGEDARLVDALEAAAAAAVAGRLRGHRRRVIRAPAAAARGARSARHSTDAREM